MPHFCKQYEREMATLKSNMFIHLMWLKYEWKSTSFWLLFPLLASFVAMQLLNLATDSAKVPVGIVIEKQSPLTEEIIQQLSSQQAIEVVELRENQALNMLEQHKLDSVFIFKRDYDEGIANEKRRIIEAYSSNRSYAYFSTVELIQSLVQQQATRGKLVNEAKQLLTDYNRLDLFDEKQLLEESKNRQFEKDLIEIDYHIYNGTTMRNDVVPFITIWSFWTMFSMLTTFFLFDWVVKERQQTVQIRWQFMRETFSNYALKQLFLYLVVLFMTDLLFMWVVGPMSLQLISSIFVYRIIMTSMIFFVAHLFNVTYFYYVTGLFITIVLAVLSGGFMPLDALTKHVNVLTTMHFPYAFLQQHIPYGALIVVIIAYIIYCLKGRRYDANR